MGHRLSNGAAGLRPGCQRHPLHRRQPARAAGARGRRRCHGPEPVPRPAPVHPLGRHQPEALPGPADGRARQGPAPLGRERHGRRLRGRPVRRLAAARPVRQPRGDHARRVQGAAGPIWCCAGACTRRRSAPPCWWPASVAWPGSPSSTASGSTGRWRRPRRTGRSAGSARMRLQPRSYAEAAFGSGPAAAPAARARQGLAVPGPGLARTDAHPGRHGRDLWRPRRRARPSRRGARGRQRLWRQSDRRADPLPPRHPRHGRARRLPLGSGAQTGAARLGVASFARGSLPMGETASGQAA